MEPHHIGYLVRDMDSAIQEFLLLGYTAVSEITYDEYRDIKICFLQNQRICVELVMPVSARSVVAPLLKKLGPMPYCYCVDDIQKVANDLRDRGYIPMGEIAPAPALHNSPAAFYFKRQIGIVELICHD